MDLGLLESASKCSLVKSNISDLCEIPRALKRPRHEVDRRPALEENEIVLRSNEHANVVLNQLRRQRESGTLCDVRLRVGGEEFFAHRSVLAASSDFLYALLMGGWKESNEEVICLDGVDADSFRSLLNFIYSAELRASDVDDLVQLLVAAEQLGIVTARPICVQRLQERLDLPNALRMRLLAQQVKSAWHCACHDRIATHRAVWFADRLCRA